LLFNANLNVSPQLCPILMIHI